VISHYAVTVKKECGSVDEYDRYEVHKDVFYYIHQLEVALCDELSAHKLKLQYPSRFPAFQGYKPKEK